MKGFDNQRGTKKTKNYQGKFRLCLSELTSASCCKCNNCKQVTNE